jgi:hypothetical protein
MPAAKIAVSDALCLPIFRPRLLRFFFFELFSERNSRI